MSTAKLLAYQTINKKGRANKVRNAIINYMADKNNNSATIYELINDLRISHQTITGQLSAMADLGLIIEDGSKTFDKILYTQYRLTKEHEMEMSANIRKFEKYQRWLKSGINNFPDYMPERILTVLKREYNFN